jgi:oligopeptide/dipeptide ABC transporter ATP-binding protein
MTAEIMSNPIASEQVMLEVQRLSVHYHLKRDLRSVIVGGRRVRLRAVDGVSFMVRKGELVALVGESGCGKTTTALAILRLVDPDSGTIRLSDRDITNCQGRELKAVRQKLQLILQDPYESLDPRFRVRKTLEEPLVAHGLGGSRSERRRRASQALELVGLAPADEFMDRYPHELSGGQRQRVAIAAALVLEPTVLVADEPVSMLDVSVRKGVLAVLDRLCAVGLGILMITHDLATAASYADRILVMYLGRIVEEGTPTEVIERPQHPYTRALLDAVPEPDPRIATAPRLLRGETPDPAKMPSGCRFHPRCPVALPVCATLDPQLRSAPDGPTHRAACVLVETGDATANLPAPDREHAAAPDEQDAG